jgi:hypothetical protein
MAAESNVKAFVKYALAGFYEQHAKANKSKKLWMLRKTALQKVLGTTRIGYAQREELTNICKEEGVGMAELADRFIFFAPNDVEHLMFDMTSSAEELKKLTIEFHRLKRSEADREWAERFE